MRVEKVPIWQKATLTIKEAAEYNKSNWWAVKNANMWFCAICRKKEIGKAQGVWTFFVNNTHNMTACLKRDKDKWK